MVFRIRKWGLLQDKVIECWLIISMAYRVLAKPEFEVRAKDYARTAYRACVGEDETFKETYGKFHI